MWRQLVRAVPSGGSSAVAAATRATARRGFASASAKLVDLDEEFPGCVHACVGLSMVLEREGKSNTAASTAACVRPRAMPCWDQFPAMHAHRHTLNNPKLDSLQRARGDGVGGARAQGGDHHAAQRREGRVDGGRPGMSSYAVWCGKGRMLHALSGVSLFLRCICLVFNTQ